MRVIEGMVPKKGIAYCSLTIIFMGEVKMLLVFPLSAWFV